MVNKLYNLRMTAVPKEALPFRLEIHYMFNQSIITQNICNE